MFVDKAKIYIRSGKGGDGHQFPKRTFMYQPAIPMAETAARAET